MGRKLREAPHSSSLSQFWPLLSIVQPSAPPIIMPPFPIRQIPGASALCLMRSGFLIFTQRLVAEQSAAHIVFSVIAFTTMASKTKKKATEEERNFQDQEEPTTTTASYTTEESRLGSRLGWANSEGCQGGSPWCQTGWDSHPWDTCDGHWWAAAWNQPWCQRNGMP